MPRASLWDLGPEGACGAVPDICAREPCPNGSGYSGRSPKGVPPSVPPGSHGEPWADRSLSAAFPQPRRGVRWPSLEPSYPFPSVDPGRQCRPPLSLEGALYWPTPGHRTRSVGQSPNTSEFPSPPEVSRYSGWVDEPPGIRRRDDHLGAIRKGRRRLSMLTGQRIQRVRVDGGPRPEIRCDLPDTRRIRPPGEGVLQVLCTADGQVVGRR